MNGNELINFIEERGIQLWPERKGKDGPILQWWVQHVSPFLQVHDASLKGALAKLDKVLRNA